MFFLKKFGSGRAAITTKFIYSLELLHPGIKNKKGILGIDTPRPRGLSVDIGQDEIKQTVDCIEYITFNKNIRRIMEEEAGLRGYKMNWDFVGEHFLRYLEFTERLKRQRPGKDPLFKK